MDNPVEIAFTDEGEPLGTVNIFYRPQRGDAIVHWIDGGVYPGTTRASSGVPAHGRPAAAVDAPRLGRRLGTDALPTRDAFGERSIRDNLLLARSSTRTRSARTMLQRDGADVPHARRGLPRPRPTTTSTRPTCSKTPTAACW